jgi:hypothetical protein
MITFLDPSEYVKSALCLRDSDDFIISAGKATGGEIAFYVHLTNVKSVDVRRVRITTIELDGTSLRLEGWLKFY